MKLLAERPRKSHKSILIDTYKNIVRLHVQSNYITFIFWLLLGKSYAKSEMEDLKYFESCVNTLENSN